MANEGAAAPRRRKGRRSAFVLSVMAKPSVIAHLVSDEGLRICSATDQPGALELTHEAWLTHVQWDQRSVIRCGRCAELLRYAARMVRLGPASTRTRSCV